MANFAPSALKKPKRIAQRWRRRNHLKWAKRLRHWRRAGRNPSLALKLLNYLCPLLAAKIPFGRLNPDVPQKELYLLQLVSRCLARPGKGPTQVVRRQLGHTILLADSFTMCQTAVTKTLAQIASDPRVTVRRAGPPDPAGRCVVYWMQRAQRVLDNSALDTAVRIANFLQQPVVIFFAPVPFYPHANLRHFVFLAEGIPQTAAGARARGIGYVLRRYPEHSLLKFCAEVKASLVVGDENPMREPKYWRELAARKLTVPLWTVDADVIVPSKLLAKEQYAARVIRPRLQARLQEFLVPHPNPKARVEWEKPRRLSVLPDDGSADITEAWKELDRSVQPVTSFHGGDRPSFDIAARICDRQAGPLSRAPRQAGARWYQPIVAVSALRTHRATNRRAGGGAGKVPRQVKDDFLDQLITWRELSINFVHFNPLYDSIESAPDWAHRTLAAHAGDPRPRSYSRQQLERAETYDDLWNAAQRQMLHAGWMHNYMRMYWAKKILEWSPSPAVAYQTAVYLNDKYFLDGRDPNGYAGIAWSIAGKFDRPWFDRPIFGTVRYMSGNAARKKFDAERYIEQMAKLA